MPYDNNRKCKRCGQSSVWSDLCRDCELWHTGYMDGYAKAVADVKESAKTHGIDLVQLTK